MGVEQGDEFSFPVTKTPQLEEHLMRMPKRIYDQELLIYDVAFPEKTGCQEEVLSLKEIELNYLNNFFAALQSVSRMV